MINWVCKKKQETSNTQHVQDAYLFPVAGFLVLSRAPVAQWIERRFPKP